MREIKIDKNTDKNHTSSFYRAAIISPIGNETRRGNSEKELRECSPFALPIPQPANYSNKTAARKRYSAASLPVRWFSTKVLVQRLLRFVLFNFEFWIFKFSTCFERPIRARESNFSLDSHCSPSDLVNHVSFSSFALGSKRCGCRIRHQFRFFLKIFVFYFRSTLKSRLIFLRWISNFPEFVCSCTTAIYFRWASKVQNACKVFSLNFVRAQGAQWADRKSSNSFYYFLSSLELTKKNSHTELADFLKLNFLVRVPLDFPSPPHPVGLPFHSIFRVTQQRKKKKKNNNKLW